MESIEEQWNHPPPRDITSDLRMDIANAKKAVKTWILDHGESWALSTRNNKTCIQLNCLSKSCPFYI
jgi:hypothetical protein